MPKNTLTIALLLLLGHFSHVWLCATRQTASHKAPPSLGFSRQEHWTGLPFPFPMHESEKWKWSCSVVSDSKRPHRRQPTRLRRPWDSPGKNTGLGCHFLLQCMKVKKVKSLSRVRLLETSWTAAYQAPPSMGFSRQEYWSGVPLPSPKAVITSSYQNVIKIVSHMTEIFHIWLSLDPMLCKIHWVFFTKCFVYF